MASEARNLPQENDAPDSGVRKTTHAESEANALNAALRNKLDALKPLEQRENYGGPRFVEDARLVMRLEKDLASKQLAIRDLADRVPPGANTEQAKSGLQAEMDNMRAQIAATEATYGDDVDMFRIDVDSLRDFRIKIDTKKAEIQEINKALDEGRSIRGMNAEGMANLADAKARNIAEIEGKYDAYEKMLRGHYFADQAIAKEKTESFAKSGEGKAVKKELFGKENKIAGDEIDSMLAKMETSAPTPEEQQLDKEIADGFAGATMETGVRSYAAEQKQKERTEAEQGIEIMERRVLFLQQKHDESMKSLNAFGIYAPEAAYEELAKKAMGGFFKKLLSPFSAKGRALEDFNARDTQLKDAQLKLSEMTKLLRDKPPATINEATKMQERRIADARRLNAERGSKHQ